MMNLAKNILFVVILTLSLANCATLDPAAEATPVFTEKKTHSGLEHPAVIAAATGQARWGTAQIQAGRWLANARLF